MNPIEKAGTYTAAAQTCTDSLSFPCHRHLPEPQTPLKPPATGEWLRSPPGAAVPAGCVQGRSGQRSAPLGSPSARTRWEGAAGGRDGSCGRGRAEAWWGSPAPWAPSPRAENRRKSALPRRLRDTSRPAARTAPCPPGRRPVRSLPRCPQSQATALGADLDGLPVVHFHHVKIETVNPFPGRDESAPLRVEVAADIH